MGVFKENFKKDMKELNKSLDLIITHLDDKFLSEDELGYEKIEIELLNLRKKLNHLKKIDSFFKKGFDLI